MSDMSYLTVTYNIIYEQPLNKNGMQDHGHLTNPDQLPQYGKAAQSNDRLAFLRSNKRLLRHLFKMIHAKANLALIKEKSN